ncbi:MAG: hypothetical protein M1826_005028 [Phylliscum demangeonii]|nr:MAG: hypothetical protein M1826_005028 [Phylliscum demangeonii]
MNFTLVLPEGNPINVTEAALDEWSSYNVRITANFGCQLGASILLLIIMVLMTKARSRRSWVFGLNVLALALNTVRTLLQILFFTSGFNDASAFFTGDFSRVRRSDYAVSITADVLTTLLLVNLETSLLLQAHVVCITVPSVYRKAILGLASFVGFVAVGFRAALSVENIKFILHAADFSPFLWLTQATNATSTVSIWVFCLIFVTKLGMVMWGRRRLGMPQLGAVQILFIGGCQTMILPALFSVLQNFTVIPEMGSNVLTVTAISLPLTAMWASSLDRAPAPILREPASERHLRGSRSTAHSGPAANRSDPSDQSDAADSIDATGAIRMVDHPHHRYTSRHLHLLDADLEDV